MIYEISMMENTYNDVHPMGIFSNPDVQCKCKQGGYLAKLLELTPTSSTQAIQGAARVFDRSVKPSSLLFRPKKDHMISHLIIQR